MSADEGAGGGQDRSASGPADAAPPSEEELRARVEEELRNLKVEDVLLQSIVSIINLSARRIVREDERDLEQARVGIDAVRRVVDLLEGEPAKQVRTALSEVQILFAKESGGAPAGAGEGGAGTGPESAEAGTPPAQPPPDQPERKRPPGLWTPPGV